MLRETTQEKTESHTFVVIVDEDVAGYIEENEIIDTNAYMVKLIKADMERKHGKRNKVGHKHTHAH